MQNKTLSDTWLKASVLGCLWASSEIVLGSFLHNLKVPFASNFLTAIGIILLISVSYIWKDRGLIWRSGIICALMKAVSPSAVILSPMIAIFFEALLLEFAVTIFRKNIFAYLVGGMLAMSWTFVHKIAAYLIIYGFNLVELYRNLAIFAQKQLHIQIENIWSPVIVLWLLYGLMGIIAAILGIYIGKKAIKTPLQNNLFRGNNVYRNPAPKPVQVFKHSLMWLIVNGISMIGVLLLMNYAHWIWWSSAGVAIACVWAIKYRNVLHRLKKPGFWLFFVAITMISSILFSKFSANTVSWIDGLMIGLQMNVRAVIMVMGFAVIGTELSNPVIKNFFARTPMRQVTPALETAFETLPYAISSLPDIKMVFRKPVSIIQQIVMQSEYLLEKIKLKQFGKENVVIITGEIHQGKTSILQALIPMFKEQNLVVGGIISPGIFEDNMRIGYDIIDVATGERRVLSRTTGSENMIQIGKYFLHDEGLVFGTTALSVENNWNSNMIVVDEIGPMELDNQGWAQSVGELLQAFDVPMIFAVRKGIIEQVTEEWAITDPLIIDAEKCDTTMAFSLISNFFKNKKMNTVSEHYVKE